MFHSKVDLLVGKRLEIHIYEYKDKLNVKVSRDSARTDVANISRVLDDRDSAQGTDLFSIHTYLISADQNLIAWSEANYGGVPIAVLPSVWLTIMLRFSGRSKDDYQSFCSFMSLRLHSEAEANIFDLITRLNENVSDRKTKERIIDEIVHHKDMYPIDEEFLDDSVKKAFDVILKQEGDAAEQKLKMSMAEMAATKDKEIEDVKQNAKEEAEYQKQIADAEKKDTAIRFAIEDKLNRKTRLPRWIVGHAPVFNIILVIACGIIFALYARQLDPVYMWLQFLFPAESEEISVQLAVLGILWGAVMLITNSLIQYAKYYISQEHESELRKKFRKEYTQSFEDYLTEDIMSNKTRQ